MPGVNRGLASIEVRHSPPQTVISHFYAHQSTLRAAIAVRRPHRRRLVGQEGVAEVELPEADTGVDRQDGERICQNPGRVMPS